MVPFYLGFIAPRCSRALSMTITARRRVQAGQDLTSQTCFQLDLRQFEGHHFTESSVVLLVGGRLSSYLELVINLSVCNLSRSRGVVTSSWPVYGIMSCYHHNLDCNVVRICQCSSCAKSHLNQTTFTFFLSSASSMLTKGLNTRYRFAAAQPNQHENHQNQLLQPDSQGANHTFWSLSVSGG